MVCVSARDGNGLDKMRLGMYNALEVIRVYTKAPGQKADLTEPVVMKNGSTVEAVAESIHKDFGSKLKHARGLGSGEFDGQKVKRQHVLQEGDIIELHV